MPIKLIDKSEVITGQKKLENGGDCICPVVVIDKNLKIISAGKIIKCERRELGLLSNCALCEGVSKEMFGRCKNRWNCY